MVGPSSSAPSASFTTLIVTSAPAASVASCAARRAAQTRSGDPSNVVPNAPTAYWRPDATRAAMAASTWAWGSSAVPEGTHEIPVHQLRRQQRGVEAHVVVFAVEQGSHVGDRYLAECPLCNASLTPSSTALKYCFGTTPP